MPFDNAPTEITVDTPASLMLEAAIKLIRRPKNWCRQATVIYRSDRSVSYCAWGAVQEAWREAFVEIEKHPDVSTRLIQANEALHVAAVRHNYPNIADLNDDPSVTHTTVLEVMREAVEIARGTRCCSPPVTVTQASDAAVRTPWLSV